ncbi:hypothetical protein BGW42_004090 [Actinomortierella wolfii]|nr:hypothetical protein BGW42_004090 [Actinomortierella wolfii]
MNLRKILLLLIFGVKLALTVTFGPMSYSYDAPTLEGSIVVTISGHIANLLTLYLSTLSDPYQVFHERTTVYVNGYTYVIRIYTQDLTGWGGSSSDYTISNLEALGRYARNFVNGFPASLRMPMDAGMIMYSSSKCTVAAIHYMVDKYRGRVNSLPRLPGNETFLIPKEISRGDFTDVAPVPDPEILKMPPVPFQEVKRDIKTRVNAIQPLGGGLCKRSDSGDMARCMGPDTLISGNTLAPGRSLWSDKGARLYVESDGNLCLYYYDPAPKNYWCINWGKPSTEKFAWALEQNGNLCRWQSDGFGNCIIINGVKDGRFRLTLQNDGNLVLYRGAFEQTLWASNTNILSHTVSKPCDTPVS